MLNVGPKKTSAALSLRVMLLTAALLIPSVLVAGDSEGGGLFLRVTEIQASKRGGEKFFDTRLGELIPLLQNARLDYDFFQAVGVYERELKPEVPGDFPLKQCGPMTVRLGSPSPDHPGYVSLGVDIKGSMRTEQYMKPSGSLMLHIPAASGDSGTILMLHLRGTPPPTPVPSAGE